MTVLHDIERAAYDVATGRAGDIIPVATNFSVVRFPRESGWEYRVFSYRTLVALVTRPFGEGVRVDMCTDALRHSATTSRHVCRFINGVVSGRVDWERLRAMCEAATGSTVVVPTV